MQFSSIRKSLFVRSQSLPTVPGQIKQQMTLLETLEFRDSLVSGGTFSPVVNSEGLVKYLWLFYFRITVIVILIQH